MVDKSSNDLYADKYGNLYKFHCDGNATKIAVAAIGALGTAMVSLF